MRLTAHPSAGTAIRDGWTLCRDNFSCIAVSALIIIAAQFLHGYLSTMMRVPFVELAPAPDSVLGVMAGVEYMPAFTYSPAGAAILLVLNPLLKLPFSLLTFYLMALTTTRAWLRLTGGRAALADVRRRVRPHWGRLLRLWPAFFLLTQLPDILSGIKDLIQTLNYQTWRGIPPFAFTVIFLLAHLVLVLFSAVGTIILTYLVCHVVFDDECNPVRAARSLALDTAWPLIAVQLIIMGLALLLTMLDSVLSGADAVGALLGATLGSFLLNTLSFYPHLAQVALYHRVTRPAQDEDETPGSP